MVDYLIQHGLTGAGQDRFGDAVVEYFVAVVGMLAQVGVAEDEEAIAHRMEQDNLPHPTGEGLVDGRFCQHRGGDHLLPQPLINQGLDEVGFAGVDGGHQGNLMDSGTGNLVSQGMFNFGIKK